MRVRSLPIVLGIATVALAGCGGLVGGEVQGFVVGQCLQTDGSTTGDLEEVGALPVVDCDDSHDAEVFAVAETAVADFDVAALQGEVSALCLAQFEPYVGTPYDQSTLFASTLLPTSESWAQGDREIVCLLIPDEGQTFSGSYKGSGA